MSGRSRKRKKKAPRGMPQEQTVPPVLPELPHELWRKIGECITCGWHPATKEALEAVGKLRLLNTWWAHMARWGQLTLSTSLLFAQRNALRERTRQQELDDGTMDEDEHLQNELCRSIELVGDTKLHYFISRIAATIQQYPSRRELRLKMLQTVRETQGLFSQQAGGGVDYTEGHPGIVADDVDPEGVA